MGRPYLPHHPIYYKSKKTAQEAHEAIRPTSVERTPESLKHQSGAGPLEAVQPDLEPVCRVSDESGDFRSDGCADRSRASAVQGHGIRAQVRRLSWPFTRRLKSEEAKPDAEGRSRTACCLSLPRENISKSKPCCPRSTLPSRRRAIMRPAWSRRWRRAASGGPAPMPQS